MNTAPNGQYPIKNYCVFCSSSEIVDGRFFTVAEALGAEIAAAGGSLVYGGGHVGLMGQLARAVRAHGGGVIGVSIDMFEEMELSHAAVTELIVTRTMAERKQVMFDRADAFITLPGGFGTLDELSDVLTLKQLGFHTKPVVILNIDGAYDMLLAQFEMMIAQKFVRQSHRDLFFATASIEDALAYLREYRPHKINNQWFKTDD